LIKNRKGGYRKMLTYSEERTGRGIGAVVMGPVAGLAYVVSMPFITIAVIITLMCGRALEGILGLLRSLATFGWRPSEAYLSGRKRKKKAD
jgi:hypothetical protein